MNSAHHALSTGDGADVNQYGDGQRGTNGYTNAESCRGKCNGFPQYGRCRCDMSCRVAATRRMFRCCDDYAMRTLMCKLVAVLVFCTYAKLRMLCVLKLEFISSRFLVAFIRSLSLVLSYLPSFSIRPSLSLSLFSFLFICLASQTVTLTSRTVLLRWRSRIPGRSRVAAGRHWRGAATHRGGLVT